MRQFGSSKKPEYLTKQIKNIEEFVNDNAHKLNHSQIMDYYNNIDRLNFKLLSITSPDLAREARQEYEAHQNADF